MKKNRAERKSRVVLIWSLAATALVWVACQQPPTIRTEPGEVLYRRYCASCHGLTGRGDGPVAESLQPKPADLAGLAERHGGSYPVDEVMKTIDGRRTIRAHGESTMPVWGEVFEEELKDAPHAGRTTLFRTRFIAEYLRTLQRRD